MALPRQVQRTCRQIGWVIRRGRQAKHRHAPADTGRNRLHTGKFGGRPNGITRANDKIYVTHEGSRTEIFDAKNHQFLTCIGNGSWGTGPTQTVHAFDVLLYKGLVMIHDKRYVNFVEEQAIQSGVTPRIYVRSEHLGETNGTYGMAVDEQTGLLYSTHPAKRIDLFAPDGIREGVSPKRTGQLGL